MAKKEELTLEKFTETANLMKQLHLPLIVVEMAKELGVKRTELMRFINEHEKNINLELVTRRKYAKDGRVTSRKEFVEVSGIYANPRENPLTEEYAEERKKEHWICLRRIWYEGWVRGFEPIKKQPWENQTEDMNAYLTLPGVEEHQFALGYAQGSYMSDWHSHSVKPCDFNKMVEEGHKMGLRFTVDGFYGKEINSLDDMPEEHFC